MDCAPISARRELAVSSPAHAAREVTPFAWPTLALVRSVSTAAVEGCLTDEHLRVTARMLAEDARGQGLPVERLLVALKRVWASMAEVRQLRAHDAGDLLDHLVSLCIRAYYGRDELALPLDRARAARPSEPLGLTARSAATDAWIA